jgi:parallel beta-helix repeat protein
MRPSPSRHVRTGRFLALAALLAPLLVATVASSPALALTWNVSPGSSGACTTADPSCATIQAAVDASTNGDGIEVAAGLYTGTIDIVGRSNLTIVGVGRDLVTIRPATLLNWNVGGYGSSRKTAIRVVDSTAIDFSGLTFDFATISGNNVSGVLYWNSSGEHADNRYRNMGRPDSGNFYGELTSYWRAPGPPWTDANRATIRISGCEFLDTGRLGIVSHDFVQMVVENSSFTKSYDDFGYAMEIGSRSSAAVSGCSFAGFDTPAASDGSTPAAIYVENSFTGGLPHCVKNVSLTNNTISGCEVGLWIGNELDGYAGDVDVVVSMTGNTIENGSSSAGRPVTGVLVVDEDRSAGSSVSLTGVGNRVRGMTSGVGYWIYTFGDGEIHADVDADSISSNGIGLLVEDYGTAPSGSLYDISFNGCRIAGNTTGASNTTASSVDATGDWWGCNGGPGASGGGCTGANGISSGITTTGPLAMTLSLSDAGPIPAATGTSTATVALAAPNNTPVSFSALLGSMAPTETSLSGGAAASVFSAGFTQGTATVSAVVDQQTLSRSLAIGPPAIVWVDDDWAGLANGTLVSAGGGDHMIGADAFAVIQDGVSAVATSGRVNVLAGSYVAEVNVPRAMTIHGAGMDLVSLVGRWNAGGATTLNIAASNVTVEGMTITRNGNDAASWATNVKQQGIRFAQGISGSTLRECRVTGNRNGIYLNTARGNAILDNVVTFNRTGIHLVNDVTGLVVVGNEITDNWTVGLLLNTVTPSETSATTALSVTDNRIDGNWYSQVECRWTLSTAILDVTMNYLGGSDLTVRSTNAGEPGYAAQIPVAYGGTAVPPGNAASVGGVTSNRIDYSPWLDGPTDLSPGLPGFEGDTSFLDVATASPKVTSVGQVRDGIDRVQAGGTVRMTDGTYVEEVVVDRSITLTGQSQGGTILLPATSAPNPCSDQSLCPGATTVVLVRADDVTISNLTIDGNNPSLTSGVVRDTADLDARNGIASDYTSGNWTGLAVHHCTAKNVYLRGINTTHSGGTHSFDIHDNIVTNVQGDDSSIAIFASYGTGRFAGNFVSRANDGISSNWSHGIDFVGNTVSDSSSSWGSGMHSDNSGGGGGINVPDLFDGNTISGCPWGLWIFVPYLGPTVRNNEITDFAVGLSAISGAFPPSSTPTTRFENNGVTGSGTPDSIAFYATATTWYWGESDCSVSLHGNSFSNAAYGIYVEPLTKSVSLAGSENRVTGCGIGGYVDAGSSLVDFRHNAIAGNGTGFTTNVSAALADVTCNWWGAATGPTEPTANPEGRGDSVGGNLSWFPWSTADLPATDCLGLARPILSSTNLTGVADTGTARAFDVVVRNPSAGKGWTDLRFEFRFAGASLADVTLLELFSGGSWSALPLSPSGPDLVAASPDFPLSTPDGPTTFPLRVTLGRAKAIPLTVTLVDVAGGGVAIRSLSGSTIGRSEVSGTEDRPLTLTKNLGDPTRVDLRFEEVGAARYSLYVSVRPDGNPMKVTDPLEGKHDCSVATAPDGSDFRRADGYDPASALTGDTGTLFIRVTEDNGAGTEGSLGTDWEGNPLSADGRCDG